MKQGNISVCHRLSLFVNYRSRKVFVGLVSTFYIQLVVATSDHSDRVESYGLENGVFNGQVAYACRYAEVFKLVVHKVYGVVAGRLIKVAQHFRHRDIIILSAYFLGITDNDNQ